MAQIPFRGVFAGDPHETIIQNGAEKVKKERPGTGPDGLDKGETVWYHARSGMFSDFPGKNREETR